MKFTKIIVSISLSLAFLFLCNANRYVQSAEAEKENQCVKCHTSASNLIKITREIAETRQSKPAISSETSGEG